MIAIQKKLGTPTSVRNIFLELLLFYHFLLNAEVESNVINFSDF